MGKELTGQLASPPAAPSGNSLPAAPAGGSAPSKQTRGDRTPAAAAAGRTPAATASGNTPAGTAAGKTAEKAQSVGLASVTPPPVPEAPKKKQQRKPRQKKQEQPTSFNAQQISALIVSVSAIAASRPDLEMFAISEMEAMQIATPLANMIAKNENLAGLGEHADAIALVTAAFVIMAPRLMIYFDRQKEKKLKAAGGMKLVRTDTQKATGNGDSGKAARSAPAPSEIDGNSIYAAMPPIAD